MFQGEITINSLISIIITAYNSDKFIGKCLDSLINQSYSNIEIIIINDGSTDESGRICDEHSDLDSRIKVFHQNNKGISAARNKGIEHSNGEYIIFMDSDDWVINTYVENLYSTLIEFDADVVVCDYIKSYNKDEDIDITFKGSIDSNDISILNRKQALLSLVSSEYVKMTVVWGKIYKKTVIDEYRFLEGFWHEDEYFIHNVYSKLSKLVLINKAMIYYRQHQDSFSSAKFELKRKLDFLGAMEQRINLFKNESLDEYLSFTYRRRITRDGSF